MTGILQKISTTKMSNATTAAAAAAATVVSNGFSLLPRVLHKIEDRKRARVVLHGLRSHEIVFCKNLEDCLIEVQCNQRCHALVMVNCLRCSFHVQDSAVVASKTFRGVNVVDCVIHLEDCDVRKVSLWRAKNTKIMITNDPMLAEEYRVFFGENCDSTNSVQLRKMVTDSESESGFRFATRWQIAAPDTTTTTTTTATSNNNNNNNDNVVSAISLFPLDAPQRGYLADPNVVQYTPAMIANGGMLSSDIIVKNLAKFLLPSLPSDEADIKCPAASPEALLADLKRLEDNPPAVDDKMIKKAFEDERLDFYDSPDTVREKVAQVVKMMGEAQYVTFFAGAGVSVTTSTDLVVDPNGLQLNDFRSGTTGLWTQRDRGGGIEFKGDVKDARPTFAHYAITELIRRTSNVKHVITTNFDCLFLRAGLPPHCHTMLHGKVHGATCSRCQYEFLFEEEVEEVGDDDERCPHDTGRDCCFCGAPLLGTIVNFCETYRALEGEMASLHSRRSDLCITLGTSMAVQPAVTCPLKTAKFVLVNLQSTPADSIAALKVQCNTNAFMFELMKQLGRIVDVDTTWDCKKQLGDVTKVLYRHAAEREAYLKKKQQLRHQQRQEQQEEENDE